MLNTIKLTANDVPHKEGLTEEEIAELWKQFTETLMQTKRPGMGRLLNWMQADVGNGTMNFINAPASTRYHGAYRGGLLEHSMNVYNWLMLLLSAANSTKDKDAQLNAEECRQISESAAVVALLHDVCKVAFYTIEMKNTKVYCENGSKEDSEGRYDWVQQPRYAVKDTHKFGHGESSIAIVEQFLGVAGLSVEERMAIRYHMADFEKDRETSEVYNRYPLAAMLHIADLAATYLEERETTPMMDTFWDTLKTFARPVKKGGDAQ